MRRIYLEHGKRFPEYKRLLRILYVAFCCFLLGTNIMRGELTYAQQTLLTLSFNNVELEEVFNSIRQQSEFEFFYSNDQVDTSIKTSIHVEKADIYYVLKRILPADYEYEINDRYVLISKAKSKMPAASSVSQQQGRTVTGVVRDASGPVIGANVVVKGTTNGTITNVDGQFTITNVPANAVLQVSFIGYRPTEVSVGNQTRLDITLSEDVEALEEVVVVGYGTLRKKDLTGSVGSVSSTVLETLATNRMEQALTGQVSGMQVISKSGMPGESPIIHIRGVGSITASAEPLYVVDGFPTDNISTLNPSDIESIDVLKDASSTAIYGSRGANGVIIVNTKRGVAGKPTITFDVSYGISDVYSIPRMMNGPELAEYAYWAVRNRNLDLGATNEQLDATIPTSWPRLVLPVPQYEVFTGKNVVDCDMVREILRTAPETRYMVGVNGGAENVKYQISAEYLNQQGVVRNTDFDRLSLRANMDVKLSNKASLKLNLNPTFTNSNNTSESSSSSYGNYMSSSAINRAQLWQSYFPARHPSGFTGYSGEDGAYFMYTQNDGSQEWNPLAQVLEVLNNSKRARILSNLNLDFQLLDELRLSIMLGGVINSLSTTYFEPRLPVFSGGGDYYNVAYGSESWSMGINWITEYTLNYNKSFGKHNLQGLAGYTMQADWSKSASVASNRYPNNLIPYLSAVSNLVTAGTSNVNEWSLISYLARVIYNYDSKYYLTVSWRADGSSRFGKNNKYGYFPSVSASWRISGENFLKDVEKINDLKLRASYGLTGNNNIGNYDHIATINYTRAVLGEQAIQGYNPARLDNPGLTWEIQKQLNLGLDISLFSNRLGLVFDFFKTNNTDLLLNVNVPATTGFTTQTKNIGEVENLGLDLQVKTENVRSKNFRWSTDFNISHVTNKVVALGPEGDPIYNNAHFTRVGHPIGMFYGYKVDGVFMNQAEVSKGPLFGRGTSNQSRPGDLRFVDINGDGIINSLDKTEMGNPYPKFTYGMTNNVSWKNLSLNVSFYGSYGNDVLNYAGVGTLNKRGNRVGQMATQLHFWKNEQEPGDGKAPRPNDTSTGGNREISQHLMDKGSFMRINNLRLNYDVPVSALRSLFNVNSMRAQIYCNVSNLYTFTANKTCFNPDISNSTNSLQPGISFSDYPLPRTVLFGVNVRF